MWIRWFAVSCAVLLLGWVASIEDRRYDPVTVNLAFRMGAQMVDKPVPGFALPDVEGRIHTAEISRGKVLIINYWASWCEPCRREMPSMIQFARDMKGRPVEVVAISHDEDTEAMNRFLASVGFQAGDFTVLKDPGGKTARAFGTELLPETYMVDREGRVVMRVQSAFDWSADPVTQLVERISRQAWRLK